MRLIRSLKLRYQTLTDVSIAGQPGIFFCSGITYKDFHHFSDEEVIELLEDFERGSKKKELGKMIMTKKFFGECVYSYRIG